LIAERDSRRKAIERVIAIVDACPAKRPREAQR